MLFCYLCFDNYSQSTFGGKVYARYGSKFIIYPGLGLFILGLFGLGLATTPMAIIFTAPLLGLGYGAAQPAFQALAIQSTPIERARVYQRRHIS